MYMEIGVKFLVGNSKKVKINHSWYFTSSQLQRVTLGDKKNKRERTKQNKLIIKKERKKRKESKKDKRGKANPGQTAAYIWRTKLTVGI